MSGSDRHSFEPRAPKDHSSEHVPKHAGHRGHAVHLNRDQPEDLAAKIMEVGSDYITSKTAAKYSEEELPQGISAVATGPNPKALANKIIKEAARELERQEGTVAPGGLASMAQKVAQHRNDPSAPEHEVAEKIRERLANEEERADHHTFQGPNPDKGSDPNNAKLRHFRTQGQPYVTGGFKYERNPDVEEPRK
jgi:hypothetical protein